MHSSTHEEKNDTLEQLLEFLPEPNQKIYLKNFAFIQEQVIEWSKQEPEFMYSQLQSLKTGTQSSQVETLNTWKWIAAEALRQHQTKALVAIKRIICLVGLPVGSSADIRLNPKHPLNAIRNAEQKLQEEARHIAQAILNLHTKRGKALDLRVNNMNTSTYKLFQRLYHYPAQPKATRISENKAIQRYLESPHTTHLESGSYNITQKLSLPTPKRGVTRTLFKEYVGVAFRADSPTPLRLPISTFLSSFALQQLQKLNQSQATPEQRKNANAYVELLKEMQLEHPETSIVGKNIRYLLENTSMSSNSNTKGQYGTELTTLKTLQKNPASTTQALFSRTP